MDCFLVELIVGEVVFAGFKLEVVDRGEGEPVTGFVANRAVAADGTGRIDGCLEAYGATVAAPFVGFCHSLNSVRSQVLVHDLIMDLNLRGKRIPCSEG